MSENSESKKQEEIRTTSFQNPWRVFFWEALLFSFTLILGIFTSVRLGNFIIIKETPFFVEIQPPSDILPPGAKLFSSVSSLSLIQFILYFLIGLLFILFIIFILKSKIIKRIIFKAIFILATGLGGILTFSVWQLGLTGFIIVLLSIFLWLKTKSILVHNSLLILGIVGMGSATGLRMAPWEGVVLLILFSIYDYLAVYKTKHMVKMAKEMAEQEAILAIILPQQTSDFKANLADIKPGGKFIILGGGDVAFPLLFSVSLLPTGIINSIVVALFSLLGLLASFLIFITRKERHPIPALPPLALFCILGYLITLLF